MRYAIASIELLHVPLNPIKSACRMLRSLPDYELYGTYCRRGNPTSCCRQSRSNQWQVDFYEQVTSVQFFFIGFGLAVDCRLRHMLLSTGFRLVLCMSFVLVIPHDALLSQTLWGGQLLVHRAVWCFHSNRRLLSCDKQSKMFLMYLGSQERVYLESEHIFEGTKLRNSKLNHGPSGDNRRNMPLQYGLVLSFLFMGESAHLVCQTNVEPKVA